MLESWTLLPLVLLVLVASFAHLLSLRNLRYRDFPPPATLDRRAIRIGLDGDDVSPIRGARAGERRLQLTDRSHVLGDGAERGCMRREVDDRRAQASSRARVEQVVEGLATAGLL